MKKIAFVLLALLALASCGKEEPQQYKVQRISSVEETFSDGSVRVSKYTYTDDGYVITRKVDDALESVSRLSWRGNLEVHEDSTVVEGVLQPSRTLTIYYRDSNLSMIDSVVVKNPAGETTMLDEYTYDGTWYTVVTTEAGVKTTMKVYSTFYSTQTVQNYTYDAETENWKYVSKEETITTYDNDITIVTAYLDNVPTDKTIYQWLNGNLDFKCYEYSASSWNLVSFGTYYYETLNVQMPAE